MAPSGKLLYFVLFFFFLLGCRAGLEYSQPFPGGEFSTCEPCRLGRGKCRRMCTEDEKVVGSCKLNFFCCAGGSSDQAHTPHPMGRAGSPKKKVKRSRVASRAMQ